MSLQLSNISIEKNEIIDPENLIKNGIDIIYQTFNKNIENYTGKVMEQKKIINDLNKKIELMKQEIEMIQRENEYYKTQNKKLKKEIENLNKIINDIKGKLVNFDFNINSKQIIENKYDNNIINNSKYNHRNFNREQKQKNKELSRNPKTIRHEIKDTNFSDILFGNDIISINNDDIISEYNFDDNKTNYLNSLNRRQLHTLYSDINIHNKKYKNNYMNYHEENSKNNYYSNNRKSIEQHTNTKKNINFNSSKNINTYKRKNKVRNNSQKIIVKKDKINNEIKYLIKYRNGKNIINDNEFTKFNEEHLLECSENFDYNNHICKTFQNNKNSYLNNTNGFNCIKELKMKEITFFLEKCKAYLDNEDFKIIFQLYQTHKDEIIKNEEIIKQIKFYLKSNDTLVNLFNNIIL